MIAVDTNVVVRIVTADDPEQTEVARKMLQDAERLWLPKTVLLETEWVLRHGYDLSREVILLTKFQGLSVKEAAEELGRTHGSTRTLLWRSLSQLADLMNAE